ncbi:MAG TPA: bifunctional demethylmenaquinone methyltransferase/2-methoxy-6-polyprenyl-1,4-benzoquinol methylase UbiE [Cyanothece sp. UBA12306]|nr:bifunctional demethylmenaquinone methyltransferase/2-methoxy-6-polyprenyl-1,4-benzoquinol methylase UbiE [Cyanothece sp. UBA12306]
MTDSTWHSANEIQGIFDRIAPVYDQLNNTLSLGQHRIWKLMAVKWSEPQSGNFGLDLCCGSGDLAQLLARKVGKTGKVVGLDFSQEQLAIAHQRSKEKYPFLPLEWIEGDALNLPFADNSFDCATMGYGLRNVTDIPRCLGQLHRVLKSGSKVSILDFHRPSQPWMRSFQEWYLQNFVVPTADKFGLTEEYAYINPSLERFPTGSEQVKLAYQAGFTHAIHYPIAMGMMGVLVATK